MPRSRISWPPHSWAWLLALFSVAGFVEAMFWGQMGAFTPLYLPHLGISQADIAAWTGASTAIAAAVGIPFLPLWGALADKYARQPIIVRSFVAHVIAGLVTIAAGNIWVFVLGRAISSFSLGNSGLMMTTLSERVPQKRMGLAFGVMNSAPPIGALVGPLLGGPIVDARGFQALVALDVVLLLLVTLAMTFGYRDDYRGHATGSIWHMAGESVAIVLRSERLRALFPALFLVFAGWMLALTYVPLAIRSLYTGDSPGTAVGMVIGAGGLAAFALGPVTGALADRYGHWRVLFIALGIAVILWPLPALAGNLALFGLFWALLNGVTSGAFALSFSVLSSSASPEERGRVMAFSYVPVNLGTMIGPAIGSVVTLAGIMAVFPVAAVLTACGVGALALAARRAHAPVAPVAA